MNNYITQTAKAKGAILVGYTRIRHSEPVIIYGFPYSDMWFLKRPISLTKRLGEEYRASRDVQKTISDELKKLGYTAHDKTMFSVYGDFRPLVVSAGLGQWGHNGLVVNEDYGAGVLYAATFTNAPLVAYVHQLDETGTACRDCGECIKACPVNAFENNSFSPARCIRKLVEGCAECLRVCKGSVKN